MKDRNREAIVKFVYTYQQEIPLNNERLRRHYTTEEISNLSNNTLFKYYAYICRRLKIITKALRETKKNEDSPKLELSDALEEYLVYTHEEDNGFDEDTTTYEENFLGAKEPNSRRF